MNNLNDMIKEQKQCFQNPDGYQFECANKVLEKYIKKNKSIKSLIYPWSNFDWDYTVLVEKQYDPKILKVSSSGTIEALTKDIDALIKIVEALLVNPNPSENSGASNPNKKDNDLVPCSVGVNKIKNIAKLKNEINDIQNIINNGGNTPELSNRLGILIGKTQGFMKSCAVLNSLKVESSYDKQPYSDPFFKKKLDGEKSSSYFAKVGTCPTKINDKNACEKKGYSWISNPLFKSKNKGVNTTVGACFKDKYMYINNAPGLSIGEIKNFKGLIPSLLNNLTDLSPDKFAFVAMGYGIPGLEVQKCEGFVGNKFNKWSFILWCILIIFIINLILF